MIILFQRRMGPASISKNTKAHLLFVTTIQPAVIKASVPSTGIAANFEIVVDFINLLLAREKNLPFAYFEELLHVSQE